MTEETNALEQTPRAEPKPRVLIVTCTTKPKPHILIVACTDETEKAVQAAAKEAELPAPDFLYGLMAYQRITGRLVLN